MALDPHNPLPLYYQLYSVIKMSISRAELKPGQALPSERKLAELHNVSRITVVKAIDLLEREDLVEKQQGRGTFVKNQRESAKPIATLAFLAGGLIHPYHYSIQMGIAKVAAQKQVHLNVLAHYQTINQNSSYELDELSARIDGLLVYPKSQDDARFYRELTERGLPLVMIDRYLPDVEADSVVFDEEYASYQLTQALIRRGHKKLAFVNYREPDASSSRNRLAGFARALKNNNLNFTEDNVWLELYANYYPLEQSHSQSHLTKLLQDKLETSKVTALVAVNHDVAERLSHDLMLINSERAHHAIVGSGNSDYGLNVEVTAFGHKHPADYSPFHFAIAMQPGEILGKRATELLLERLQNKTSPLNHERIPIEVLYREGGEKQKI